MEANDCNNNAVKRLENELKCDVESNNHKTKASTPNQLFLGKIALHPQMASFSARVRTFLTWPSYMVAATAVQIATAGFYFLNEGDKVKCFFCNGGLMHWSKSDDPWVEHAKWYPQCGYVLQCKGIEFVNDVKKRFSNQQNPPAPATEERHNHAEVGIPQSSQNVTDISFEMEMEKWLNSSISTDVEILGFEKKEIAQVAIRKYEAEKKWFESSEELVGALVLYEEELEKNPISSSTSRDQISTTRAVSSESMANMQDSCFSQQTTIVPVEGSHKQKVVKAQNAKPAAHLTEVGSNSHDCQGNSHLQKERIAEIREEGLCKICLDRPIDCVLMECRHLCCCLECAQGMKQCPICRGKMTKIIKVYR